MKIPLFVCHANCCRSVLTYYLYRHLSGAAALSAVLEVGDGINDRALAMLHWWGIDAREHCPSQLNRAICDQAAGIFLMAPAHVRRSRSWYSS
jgi:protein-tyrosine-phosphatase